MSKKSKNQKLTVQISVSVPEGTSKTKVERALSSALKANTPEGFKLGAPKVVTSASTSTFEPSLA